MTRKLRRPAWAMMLALKATMAFVALLALSSGCGESEQTQGDARADANVTKVDAAVPPEARAIPKLGPSELESIEVVTGGASADDPLPLIIALHGLGDDPENFSKSFEGFEHKARFVFPQGPLPHEKGHAWFPAEGGEAAMGRALNGLADKVASLVDEIQASKQTKGKAIVTGYSQGGLIAFAVAARQPERVGAAIPIGGWLPQFAWPGEDIFLRNQPIIRALNGATDEFATATNVRRGVVKLRMMKINATVRLYADTGHSFTPVMKTDLFGMLNWLVAGTEEPSACEPCPGSSMDPESCSQCAAGEPAPETAIAKVKGRPSPAPSTSAPEPQSTGSSDGPNLSLGDRGAGTKVGRGSGGSQGGLTREEIQRAFRVNMASIRHCYDRQLANDPSLAGRVTVRLTVEANGSVSSAQIASSTLRNSTVEECVRRAVTRVQFPQPQGGRATVTYPFNFASM